jgi:hypothetical protein
MHVPYLLIKEVAEKISLIVYGGGMGGGRVNSAYTVKNGYRFSRPQPV